MNPYRSRTSGPAINRIAVVFVVLIAIGAIGASVLLGPKPNATIVEMQPIRPAQTGSVPSGTQATAPPSDPMAGVPDEQLPVIQSRPAKPVTTEPSTLEQSELGVETPAASVAPMTDGSQTVNSSATIPNATSSQTTQSAATADPVKPKAATSSPSASPNAATSPPTVSRASSSIASANASAAAKPEPVAAIAATTPAEPVKALLRRATDGVSVQVVALSSVDAAAKLAQNLATNGFTANVQPSGKIFRVVIGPYPTDAAAQAAAARASAFVR